MKIVLLSLVFLTSCAYFSRNEATPNRKFSSESDSEKGLTIKVMADARIKEEFKGLNLAYDPAKNLAAIKDPKVQSYFKDNVSRFEGIELIFKNLKVKRATTVPKPGYSNMAYVWETMFEGSNQVNAGNGNDIDVHSGATLSIKVLTTPLSKYENYLESDLRITLKPLAYIYELKSRDSQVVFKKLVNLYFSGPENSFAPAQFREDILKNNYARRQILKNLSFKMDLNSPLNGVQLDSFVELSQHLPSLQVLQFEGSNIPFEVSRKVSGFVDMKLQEFTTSSEIRSLGKYQCKLQSLEIEREYNCPESFTGVQILESVLKSKHGPTTYKIVSE